MEKEEYFMLLMNWEINIRIGVEEVNRKETLEILNL